MLKGASEDLEEYTKQAYQSVKEWGTQQFNYWTDLNEWENAIKSYGDWRTWAYNLPVSGDCHRASICFDNGDYGGGLFNWGMGFVNAFTLGYGSTLTATGTNIVGTTAVRSTTQEVVEQVAAKGVAQTATKGSGAYFLEFQSGKMYVGKGLETRMATSINRIETQFGDKLLKSTFCPTATTREAFILEHQMMLQTGYKPLFYDANSMLYNKIWSPGKTLLGQ